MNDSTTFPPNINNNLDILTIQQSSFQKNILLFKDDVLKDLKKIEIKLNSKFENSSLSMESKLNEYNLKIETLSQKVYNLSSLISTDKNLQEKVDSLLKFKDQIKENYMEQELKINSNYKELFNSIFNHDKLITESILYPGLIGQMCRFQNLHQFIDFVLLNIKELLSHKDQTITELKNYKNKIDSIIKNIKIQIEGMSKSMSDYTKKCVNLTEIRLTDIIKGYDDRINEVRLENSKFITDLQSKNENLNFGKGKIFDDKNDLYNKIIKEIEYIKQENNNINRKIENYKNDFNQIKGQISQLNDFFRETESKVKYLNEKKQDNNINNNSNVNKNYKTNKTVKNKKKFETNHPKKGKVIESFLKKYIQGEVGINEIIHRNNFEESSNENQLPNISNLEEKNNNNINKKSNNELNNIMLKNTINNLGNNFYYPEYPNEEEINLFNQRKIFKRLKNVNSQDKMFSEYQIKNKYLMDNISDSKEQNNNKCDSENEEEPKKLKFQNNKFNKSMTSEDIKQFTTRSYSVFPNLSKRNFQKNNLKMTRSFSEEERNKNIIALNFYKKNIEKNNNNSINIMTLKKLPINTITPDMFKSIDGEKGYFNNKNSLVSFIGNSIQVIHSKKHSITVKNFKSEIKEKEKEIENHKKKKDILNSSSRTNEAKELEKFVNQMKENISYYKFEKNNYDDNFISKKLLFDKNKNHGFKKNKDLQNFSLDKGNNLYNLIGNENSDIKYSKLSKILNNIPKNVSKKKNLLLNDSDKFSLNYYKDEDK